MTDVEFTDAVVAARGDLRRRGSTESAVPSIIDVLVVLNRNRVSADRRSVIERAERLAVVLCDLPDSPDVTRKVRVR